MVNLFPLARTVLFPKYLALLFLVSEKRETSSPFLFTVAVTSFGLPEMVALALNFVFDRFALAPTLNLFTDRVLPPEPVSMPVGVSTKPGKSVDEA